TQARKSFLPSVSSRATLPPERTTGKYPGSWNLSSKRRVVQQPLGLLAQAGEYPRLGDVRSPHRHAQLGSHRLGGDAVEHLAAKPVVDERLVQRHEPVPGVVQAALGPLQQAQTRDVHRQPSDNKSRRYYILPQHGLIHKVPEFFG